MKEQIVQELRAMADLDMVDANVVKAVVDGEFDADIDEMVCMSVSEAADEICDLARIRLS